MGTQTKSPTQNKNPKTNKNKKTTKNSKKPPKQNKKSNKNQQKQYDFGTQVSKLSREFSTQVCYTQIPTASSF